MPSTSLSNNPKIVSVSKGKETVAPKLSKTTQVTTSFDEQLWKVCVDDQVLSAKLAKPKTVPKGFERLREGAIKLVRLVLSHTTPKDAQARLAEVSEFQAAYASILRFVSAAERQQLLRYMREGLEEVTKTELESASTTAAGSGEDAAVSTRNFMASLEHQETDQRARDTADGVLVPAAKLASLLKMTPQGLHTALKAKRIFAMAGPSGDQVYPSFFADPKQDRKMLEKVSKALGDLPGAAKWDFFMSPRVSLGNRTPLEALMKGKFEAVMVAANGFVEE